MTIQAALDYINPFKGQYPITLGYGDPVPSQFVRAGASPYSTAIDYNIPRGTPIYAAQTGQVAEAGWNVGGGNVVEINHSGGVSTIYGHLDSMLVKTGDIVRQGEQIGFSGNTGAFTTGPHLLFGAKQHGEAINPLTLFDPTKSVDQSVYKSYTGGGFSGDTSKSPLESIGDFFGFILNPLNWARILALVVGLVLAFLGWQKMWSAA